MQAALSLAVLAGLGLLASWLDIKQRRLPNWLCLAVLVAGLVQGFLAGGLGSHTLHFAIALAGGMGLFAAGLVGGGDAKFYAGTASWFALGSALPLLVAVALSGAAVLLIWFIVQRLRGKKIVRKADADEDKVPYGVAIALGAVLEFGVLQGAGW